MANRLVKYYEVIMMKKLFSVIIAALLVLSAAAFAEEDAPVYESATVLTEGEAFEVDMDGDGTNETVTYAMRVGSDSSDPVLNIDFGFADNTTKTVLTEIVWGQSVLAYNVDGGAVILASGDIMSDDYYTWCYAYENGEIVEKEFANSQRGDNTEEYVAQGYGAVTGIKDGVVTLCGSQDVLGTRPASRDFKYVDGRFEFADDGLWIFDPDLEDPDTWEYSALTPKQAIKVTFQEEGAEIEGEIAAGEKFVVTASDKTSVVYFMTQDGKGGWFDAAPDTEKGWGWTVNGMTEEELFDSVPYAD